MAVRKTAATLIASGALLTASVVGLTGSASAHSQAVGAKPTAKSVLSQALKKHTVVKAGNAHASAVTPKLACSYKYVCGQAANGHSFAYTKCDVAYELPNLVGRGPLNNNQTAGTTSYFFDKNADPLFTSNAPQQTTVDWTPVWYAVACVS